MNKSKRIVVLLTVLILALATCFSLVACNPTVESDSESQSQSESKVTVTYTLTFNSNGGSEVDKIDVDEGATAQKPADPTKQGYDFDGWFIEDEEFSFDQAITGHLTLVAKWSPKTDTAYTVKHLQEKLDGSGYEEVVADAESLTGTTGEETQAVAKTYDGFIAQQITQGTIAPDGSSVVEVKYDRIRYLVVFKNYGGDEISSQEYPYGATVTAPNHSEDLAGYTYGWDKSIEVVADEAVYTETKTANVYGVVMVVNGGELASELTSYTYGAGATLPTDIEKVGHTFAGWYASDDFTGEPTTAISNTDLGEKTFYAKWNANTYNVNLVVNGGELTSELTSYIYGVGATLPTDIEKVGHTFAGWYASEEFTGETATAISSTDLGEKTFYAKWKVNTYNVNLVVNGGELASELTSYTYGVGATLPTDIEKVGHTFAGWYASEEFTGETATAISTTDLGEKTFYAKWTANEYDVSLVLNGGTLVGDDVTVYTYGVGATLPDLTKLGYEFEGWCANEDFEGEPVTAISNTDLGDKTYYAYFTARQDTKYTVKVLTAQYAQGYASAMYFANLESLTYVDSTATFANVFGLDSEGKAQGKTDSTIDLTKLIATLKGAKLNASSVVSGTITADEALVLTVKLDFDETALGFKLSDLKIGEYSCNDLVFSLGYVNGVCGLKIDGTIGNGKEICINLDSVTLADYAGVSLDYAETSATVNSQIAVIDGNGVTSSYPTLVSGANPHAVVDLATQFPSVSVVKEIRVKVLGGGTKNVFIAGVRKVEFKKETVTYSMANGNLAGIAKAIDGSQLSESTLYISGVSTKALYFKHDGEVSATQTAGVILNLGGLKVSDYKTITVKFQSLEKAGKNGTLAYLNGNVKRGDTFYGGVQTFDVKAFAESQNLTSITTVELSSVNWPGIECYELYVVSVELVLNDPA